MVIASLAWNLKAWYGLLVPNRERGLQLVKMEFRRFLQAILLLPCQIVRTARRVIYRVLGYNSRLADFLRPGKGWNDWQQGRRRREWQVQGLRRKKCRRV